MDKILYKIDNFNDISWMKLSVQATDTSFLVIKCWGRKLPINETANRTVDKFDTEEEAKSFFWSEFHRNVDRKGYSEEIPTTVPSLPMRCQEYRNPPNWSGYSMQPKIDGIRAIVSKDGIYTRTNKPITSCPNIEMYAHHLPEGIKLDGELYIPNTPLNVIESMVMRQFATETCKEIEFRVFDVIDLEAPFWARIDAVEGLVIEAENRYLDWKTKPNSPYRDHPYFSHKCPFKLVPTIVQDKPFDEEEFKDFFKQCRAQGYEGAIVRDNNAPYKPNSRASCILKLKEFFDTEYEIVDVEEGKNKIGVLVCQTRSGIEFKVNFKGTLDVRQRFLSKKKFFIGKWLRVEHEGIAESGKPRCPVGVHWFDKEDHD